MSGIFTKIISGELPSYKLYEDELVFAFLSIDPIQLGHALIIPKEEVDHFIDVPAPAYGRIFEVAKPLGQAIQRATGSKRIGAMIQGFEVSHAHLHLIPAWDPSDMSFAKAKSRKPEEMLFIQEKILTEMGKENL